LSIELPFITMVVEDLLAIAISHDEYLTLIHDLKELVIIIGFAFWAELLLFRSLNFWA
jgi:hypothetical protein